MPLCPPSPDQHLTQHQMSVVINVIIIWIFNYIKIMFSGVLSFRKRCLKTTQNNNILEWSKKQNKKNYNLFINRILMFATLCK